MVEATFDSLESAMVSAQSPIAKQADSKLRDVGVVTMLYEVEPLDGASTPPD